MVTCPCAADQEKLIRSPGRAVAARRVLIPLDGECRDGV